MNATAAIVSALHVLAVVIGFAAVRARASALRGTLDGAGLARVFRADAWWAAAAVLWLVSGPWRAFGELEKGTAFYVANRLFHVKFGLFLLIVLLEIAPMVALIRWRSALRRGAAPDLSRARLYARLSDLQAALVIVIVVLAAFMARGFGMRPLQPLGG